ncbi:hypothetical protein T05_13162 [Trichinella murrelli]|uniref:Uncharacterized protein n=1 Tax=Trichinella murrelli TaxID=144512 RepID=A0A0V0TZZ9_9BILA|nr:hypothetical protein T05_13162 [Trichinella murrelli]
MQTPTDEQSSRKSMSMLFIDESRFWQKFFELAALIDLIATVSNKSSGLKLEKNEFELFSILHQSSEIRSLESLCVCIFGSVARIRSHVGNGFDAIKPIRRYTLISKMNSFIVS